MRVRGRSWQWRASGPRADGRSRLALNLGSPPSGRRLVVGAAVVGLVVYGLVLIRYSTRSVGAADPSGYVNFAVSIARGELVRSIPAAVQLDLADIPMFALVPLGFTDGPRPGTMVPSYPPGMPLHMAAFASALGWRIGPYIVSPLFAVLGLVVFYCLARELALTWSEAAAGTLVLALQPAYVFLGLLPMSDTVSATWAALAVLSALRSRRSPSWAFAAGAAFAMACLVRPNNALLLPVLGLALPWARAALVRFGLGAAPVLAVLLGFNQILHGHPLRTGYGDLHEAFALGHLRQRWGDYTLWLGRTFTPIVPLAWLGVAWAREVKLRDRVLLLVWFAAYFVFFCSYYFFDMWWSLRFLLPAFPALIIGAILALRAVRRALDLRVRWHQLGWWAGRVLPLVLLAFVLGREVSFSARRHLLHAGAVETVFPRACRYAETVLPARSVVLSFLMSGALEYYTDLPYLRFDTMDRRTARRIYRRTARQGSRWFALVHPLELEAFKQRDFGTWRQIGSPAGAMLFELDPEYLLQPIR